jgi:hypothetical protein
MMLGVEADKRSCAGVHVEVPESLPVSEVWCRLRQLRPPGSDDNHNWKRRVIKHNVVNRQYRA